MTLTMASKARHRSASQGEFPEGPIEFRKSPCAAAIRRVFRWPAIPGQSHHGRRRGLAHYADPELASERVTWSRAGCGGRYTNKIRTRSSLARSSKSVRFAVMIVAPCRRAEKAINASFWNSCRLRRSHLRLAHDESCTHPSKNRIVENAFPMIYIDTRVVDGERHVRLRRSCRA